MLINLVKSYQKVISPLFAPSCRYYPTCSNYTVQAIEIHGALKGSLMAGARILRCNPFVEGGVDKVPDYFMLKRNPATKDFVYLGDGVIVNPNDPKYLKKEIELILNQYEKELKIVDAPIMNAFDQLKLMVDVEEQSVAQLSDQYVEMNKKKLLSEGYYPNSAELESRVSLRLFKVIKNQKSHSYFKHIHPSLIDKEFKSGGSVFCLIDEDIGMLDSNSPELQKEFILKRGVTESDLKEKTARLVDYLLVLKQKDYDGH